jgi:hypothetical protein
MPQTHREARALLPGVARPRRKHPALDEYFLDQAFDEMFDDQGVVRPHYESLLSTFSKLPRAELHRRKQSADLSFLMQGITFTVYGRDEGTERIFPHRYRRRMGTYRKGPHAAHHGAEPLPSRCI